MNTIATITKPRVQVRDLLMSRKGNPLILDLEQHFEGSTCFHISSLTTDTTSKQFSFTHTGSTQSL